VLDSEVDDMPLVEDVRASRSGGPDGSGLVVVEGVWGAVAGSPPPVLLVDDGTRRHTLAALDEPPRDDPMAFHATFAVPAELVDRLGDGLALGLGRTELALTLAEPQAAGEGDEQWLEGPPVIARRITPDEPAAPEPEASAPGEPEPEPEVEDTTPRGRFDRGPEAPSHASIAAAILRATSPPPEPGTTVVERSVIAERRARRSEQLAAVMERRARGAEDSAQELGDRIAALEARVAEVAAERDRLGTELELQRATAAQAQSAREKAEARLAELLERDGALVEPVDVAASIRALPGLHEAARAMREQEPVRPAPAAPADDADPFADALAKLRSNGSDDIAAAVAPRVTAEPEPIAAFAPPMLAAAVARRPSQVVPYLISAEHPRTPWLARAIAGLDERDRHAAALLVAELLPQQARGLGRPLAYDLDLDGMGALRVELADGGTGRVLARDEAVGDPAFALQATPAQFAVFAAGGAPIWPRALRTGGARMPFVRLSNKLRRRLTLADVVASGATVDPGLVVRALAQAVPAGWTMGHEFAVTLWIPGRAGFRVLAEDGRPLHVVRVEETRRAVVAATTAQPRPPALDGADALLGVSERGALPLLAQAEPPSDEEPATVVGDVAAATTLLGWFDRVQGLAPRA
jgi:hypothetical protein